jgi:dolichol-phosphate mannosyltransferase
MSDLDSAIELSVVLPAYKESEALDILLPKLRATIAQVTGSSEICVIDTQESMDRTEEVCKTHNVIFVRRRGGNNYGDAMRTGIATARGRYLLVMDADGSHNPSYIPELWRHREQCDVVIGSRYISGGGTENPKILIWLSHVVNVVFRVILGLACRDVSNSFRLYRREQLQSLRLRANNFDIVEEILIKLCFGHLRCKLIEVPMTFERRKAGHSKRNLVVFAIGYLYTLARLLRFKILAYWDRA